MARLRRPSRGLRASRVLIPVLVGGCAVFVGYLVWPGGSAPIAEAETPAVTAPAPADAGAGAMLASAAKSPQQTQAKPAGSSTGTNPSAPPTTRPIGPQPAPGFLNQAKLLQDGGKLLEARKLLNDALQAGTLDAPTADTVKARIRDLNQTIIFTPTRRYADDPQQSAYTVQPGDNLVKICRDLSVPAAFIARVNAVKPERIRAGQNLKLIKGPVHAVVNKSRFTMDLYLGDLPGKPGSVYLMTYRVGLGESGSTPTGLWEVARNSKAANPAWVNPRTNEQFAADDPKNPLGERWIGLTGVAGAAVGAVSYGIHGTIEPESIGANASMGCIRLKHDDIVAIYDMLSEGRSLVMVVE